MPDFLMLNSGDGVNFGDPALVVTNGGAASVRGPRQLLVFDVPAPA